MSENNVSSFLSKINKHTEESFSVNIPSRKKALAVSPINLKQQKDIISSIVDGVVGVISFTRILNNILIDVTGDNTLKVYDKAPLALALRVNALGTTYKENDQEHDLSVCLNNIKSHKHILPDTKTIEHNGIRININVPTLLEESVLIKKLEEEIKRNGENNNAKNLSSIYIYEIVKYVKSIECDSTTIEYTDLKMKDKIDIIESLPLALNKQIVAFIEQFRREEKEMLTIDDTVIEINPSLFDVM